MTQNEIKDKGIRSRQERLRIRLLELHAEAIVVAHLPDVRYLCGFTGSNGLLIFSGGGATLFTDSRYTVQAEAETSGAQVRISRKPLYAEAGGLLARSRARRKVLFSPGQLTVAQFALLREAAGKRVRWRGASGEWWPRLGALKTPRSLARCGRPRTSPATRSTTSCR